MVPLFAFDSWHYLYSIPLAIVSLFLILVILVQRGRGGGLTGALGGMGGQSAFGTKAGDLFTKITIVVAAIWILLAMLAIQRLGRMNVARPTTPPASKQVEKDEGKKTSAKDAATTEIKKAGADRATGGKSTEPTGGDVKESGSDAKPAATSAGQSDETKKE